VAADRLGPALHGEVREPGIAEGWRRGGRGSALGRPEDDCQRLIELAVAARGADDVTVIVADYQLH